ncbi:MAG: shikimate kinase [Lachnospiraceae bacterium]|nr:shikimate kinase [Lachnospiraceae bacterium]
MAIKSNIVLIGMPGVGKSTVGVILAKVLGYEFIDSDLVIQKQTGKLLKDIIEEKGPQGFIDVENDINSKLEADHSIIATGGSIVYGAEAMAHLKEIGTVVYLKQSLKELEHRLGNIKNRGVVLKPGQTLATLYEERIVLYEKYADITIDEENLDIEDTIKAVQEALQK